MSFPEWKHFRFEQQVFSAPLFLKEVVFYVERHGWEQGRSRIPVQRETLSITIRKAYPFESNNVTGGYSFHNQMVVKNMVAYAELSKIVSFLHSFAHKKRAFLGRAIVARLKPQGQVYEHYDFGTYYQIRDRYHLVLKSKGSVMYSGGERCVFNERELWWFDNHVIHTAHNESDEERIHVIFDLLPCKTRPMISAFYYFISNMVTKFYFHTFFQGQR